MNEMNSTEVSQPDKQNRLAEVAGIFLRLGFTAFGGPAAHIAMMRRELVQQRHWVSDEHFLDLISVINLVPGPNSTELAIYLSYLRAGWLGLIVGGACFIVPAMLIVLGVAWLYVHFGSLPQATWLFYGIQPVVIAIVAQALWGLSRTVLKRVFPIVLALVVLALYLLGVNILLLLVAGGLVVGLVRWLERLSKQRQDVSTNALLPISPVTLSLKWLHSIATMNIVATTAVNGVVVAAEPVNLLVLFLTFLKIGAILYGSGYVLLSFLQQDLVLHLHWLTDRQLLDAISIGQFTPGPVFTTATFIGYFLAGLPGALLATLAIFLPAFIFVPLIHPIASRLRRSPWTASLLDGINIAALALMAGVLIQLGRSALIDVLTWGIAIVSLAILLRFKLNSAWLIAAGALIGVLRFIV